MYFTTTLLATSSFLLLSQAAATGCFNQAGQIDLTLQVCNPSADVSACCPGLCYSNGICQGTSSALTTNATVGTVFPLGGCSMQNTGSGNCFAQFQCAGKATSIKYCGGDGEYCCGADCDCSVRATQFSMSGGSLQAPASLNSLLSSQAASSTASPTSTSAGASSMSTSAQTTTMSTTSSSAAAAQTSTKGSSGNSVAVGAGSGALVGAALLLAGGLGV